MEKIKKFFKDLFSVNSLLSGLIGLSVGIILYSLGKYFMENPFKYISIFITGVGLVFIVFCCGYIINTTLFKDDE